MKTAQTGPPTLTRRIVRLSLLSLLMGIFLTLGATATAVVAARLFLPMAAAGMTMGLIGLASSSATATMNALYTGDATVILPALDQCITDENPEVVALARDVKTMVQDKWSNHSIRRTIH